MKYIQINNNNGCSITLNIQEYNFTTSISFIDTNYVIYSNDNIPLFSIHTEEAEKTENEIATKKSTIYLPWAIIGRPVVKYDNRTIFSINE